MKSISQDRCAGDGSYGENQAILDLGKVKGYEQTWIYSVLQVNKVHPPARSQLILTQNNLYNI
ncbi:hypothetical protein OGM63_11260 [Plectonema radiosum NIES-515]|uniref:Transposase n=1 Tax=Plectonema radiosum NIES-515 TaxID=2986073 RepID=A0ABT3AY79_9CYAN|nr:hypothetical protein [Plectonema radiosum]MCV3214082.1 hypothetical protein [Plectonema radiosum NIES-515]